MSTMSEALLRVMRFDKTMFVDEQVILLKNLDQNGIENGLVNGSQGDLVGWKSQQQVWEEC